MKRALCLLLSFAFLFAFRADAMAQEPVPEQPALTPPAAPYEVAVSGIEETRATVSWSPAPTATQYTVWVDGQRWAGSSCPGAEIKGLQPYMEYTVYVTAANDAGESGNSTLVQFTTLPPVPAVPERPKISEVTGTGATIQWQPLPIQQYVQKYRIYVDGQAVADVDAQAGIQTAKLTNLAPGIHYVTVSGLNDNREGPPSLPAQVTVQTVPALSGLAVANRSHDQMMLTWDSMSGVDSYKIYLDGNPVGETKQSSYIIEDLADNVDYLVSVTAVLSDGNESISADLAVNTLPEPMGTTLNTIMAKAYEYIPDVMPGIVIVFAIGGALKIARTSKYAIGWRYLLRRYL